MNNSTMVKIINKIEKEKKVRMFSLPINCNNFDEAMADYRSLKLGIKFFFNNEHNSTDCIDITKIILENNINN